jgi:4-hydroxy-4-methyl-2-oxoglutarate aldolase
LARAAEVVALATAREAKEAAIIKRIQGGERTLEVYNF